MVIFRGSLRCGGWYLYRLRSFLCVAEVWCKQNLRCLSNRFGPEVAQGVKRGALLVEETSWDEGLFEDVFVCFFCCFEWHVFFLMGNIVIVGQEGKGDVYIFWVGIGEIRGVSLQCNGVYRFFVRRSFSCSQICHLQKLLPKLLFPWEYLSSITWSTAWFFLFKKTSGGSSPWHPKNRINFLKNPNMGWSKSHFFLIKIRFHRRLLLSERLWEQPWSTNVSVLYSSHFIGWDWRGWDSSPKTRWWFQENFYFSPLPTWWNDPICLRFFKWVGWNYELVLDILFLVSTFQVGLGFSDFRCHKAFPIYDFLITMNFLDVSWLSWFCPPIWPLIFGLIKGQAGG